MPELPEVETFVRRLAPAVGRTIASADVLDARLALSGEALVGARIEAIRRRGKYVVFDLGERGDLAIHLRMSGRLRLECDESEVRYARLILRLDDGQCVYFVNPRRLGTAVFYADGFSEPLGLEPLGAEFTAAAFAALTATSKAPIKQLLLDQRKIAGIGNIYAAEALWRAGIDPRRPANRLSKREAAALRRAIVAILSEAVDQLGTTLGTSVSDYRPTATAGGSFQNHLAVYGREGEPCERCEGRIERLIQAGRSTCFCPACQR
jgi:formamidopyrimidine-DNA glycosylase